MMKGAVMMLSRKVVTTLFFLLIGTNLQIRSNRQMQVDSMADFRCPVSLTEIVHEAVVGVIYRLENGMQSKSSKGNDILDTSFAMLEEVDATLPDRHNIRSEDREFLQNMIDRIDSLILHLEGEDQHKVVMIQNLCGSIKNKLDN